MSTHVAVIGRAFKVTEPAEGNVRNYTDAKGEHWLGHDTEDVLYYDSAHCMELDLLSAFGPLFTAEASNGTYVQRSSARRGDAEHSGAPITYATTVDYGAHPAGDWPDYDVHCARCGELMHEGGE